MTEQAIGRLLIFGPVAVAALFLSMGLIVLLRPWLARYALARPNARSPRLNLRRNVAALRSWSARWQLAWAAIVFSQPGLQSETVLMLTPTAATASGLRRRARRCSLAAGNGCASWHNAWPSTW
jgi:hypothetical protein